MIETEKCVDEVETQSDIRTKLEENPYAYLEREDFSSEKYKIEVKNLPKYYGISEFRKLLNDKLKLDSCKIKSPRRNSPYAFVCFRSDADRDAAIKTITDYKWKGNLLNAIKAKPAPDPLVKKRKEAAKDNDNGDGDSNNKKAKIDERSQEEKLKDSTIPLWRIPYEQQLQSKQDMAKAILIKIGNEIAHHNPTLQKWIDVKKKEHGGLPCELLDIRHSQQQDGYRNKCEFTVGMDEETGLKTVGFRIGSYVNGVTGVGSIDCLKHIPESMKKAVKVFERFVRDCDLDVFNPELQTGHFKQLTVRSSRDQLMLIVGIHPQNLPEEKLRAFKDSLIEYFTKNNDQVKVTSLYYQEITKKKSGKEQPPPEYLMGETHITENLLGLTFRISPEAFFQVNTLGAEVLYETAIELASPTENSTVIDVCCGTGTIGLCFSKKCAQVLGLEVIPQAIDDAKINASANNIENSEFFVGKAEDILSSVVYRATQGDVVAVVDPPRAGLHQRALIHLRKMKKVDKIVYISCNPQSAFKNFVDLGRPESKMLHGECFVPTKAVAVDLFPHTKHYELVICFERFNKVNQADSQSHH